MMKWIFFISGFVLSILILLPLLLKKKKQNLDIDQKNQEASIRAAELNEYINSLTEKELLLETKIIQKGYRDSFVHCSETGIDILVVSNESSKSLANEIIVMALTEFSNMNYNVSVNFQTAEEVMGNVA